MPVLLRIVFGGYRRSENKSLGRRLCFMTASFDSLCCTTTGIELEGNAEVNPCHCLPSCSTSVVLLVARGSLPAVWGKHSYTSLWNLRVTAHSIDESWEELSRNNVDGWACSRDHQSQSFSTAVCKTMSDRIQAYSAGMDFLRVVPADRLRRAMPMFLACFSAFLRRSSMSTRSQSLHRPEHFHERKHLVWRLSLVECRWVVSPTMMSVVSSDSGGAYLTGISSSLDLQQVNTGTALPETLLNSCVRTCRVERKEEEEEGIGKWENVCLPASAATFARNRAYLPLSRPFFSLLSFVVGLPPHPQKIDGICKNVSDEISFS